MTAERKYCAAAVLGGRLYVAGGVDAAGTVLRTVESFDPAANAWRRERPMRCPRANFALVAAEKRGERLLFAVGGRSDLDEPSPHAESGTRPLRGVERSVELFRPAAGGGRGEWSDRPADVRPMATPRCDHAAVALHKRCC